MGKTPSNRRREGRNAFEPGVSPLAMTPYTESNWLSRIHHNDWLGGWREAEAEWKKDEAEAAKLNDILDVYEQSVTMVCPHCYESFQISTEK